MIPPRLIAYGLAGLAAAGSLWWVAHTVSQWRAAYQERPALIRARDQAQAEIVAHVESSQRLMGVLTDTEAQLDAERQRKARTVRVYRDAVASDPSCAAWAAERIACPSGPPP